MAVRHALLGLLARSPGHGYELKSEFDQLTCGLWDLNIGQVYSTLERLRKDGLVALEEDEGEGDDRKVYRVTEAGLVELGAWLRRPPLKPRPLRDEILVRLGLLLERDPAQALELAGTQRRIYHLQLAELTRRKLSLNHPPGVERLRQELLLDAAIQHTEADLNWLESCETKVRIFMESQTRRQERWQRR